MSGGGALAFDFGASSGRAILGCLENGRIQLEELHRFPNEPVCVHGRLYWDVLRLFHEIKQGLTKAADGFSSVGIDTWGVDFALLGEDGALLENPVHYRDSRTVGLVDASFALLPKEEQYGIAGIQFMELNTIYQLLSLRLQRPFILDRAQRMLFMPDLFGYLLTGKQAAEYSIATTSQMVDIRSGSWSETLLEAFEIPKKLLSGIVPSGTVLGPLSEEVCQDCGVPPVNVISVCGHDTQSAITAVPSKEKDFVFLSSGTWSLFGTELEAPIVNETSLALNFTNEGGFGQSVGFLKNIVGLWLIQESRRQYNRQGGDYSYADLERLALETAPFRRFIDPDAPEFLPPGDMPRRVRDYCLRTGQTPPETVGETIRCIYESLALKYRRTLEELQTCTGKRYSKIHVIGGGVKDGLLCRMTAAACDCTVLAGPVEATVLGNIALQFIARGEIADVAEAREIIAESAALKVYEPQDTADWKAAYGRFLQVLDAGR